MKEYLNLNYKEVVLPWFKSVFLGRAQESPLRVVTVCDELYSAVCNRLVKVYISTLLSKDEVIIEMTPRGQKICDAHVGSRFCFPPENGFDDKSLQVYMQSAVHVNIDKLLANRQKYSLLDAFVKDLQ